MILGKYLMMLPPSAVSNPLDDYSWALRLEADALTLSDTDPVATWADTSGNSNDATQAAEANKPLYRTNIFGTEPAVSFDGVNDSMALPNVSPAGTTHIFAVLDTTNLGTSYRILLDRVGGQPTPYVGSISNNYKPMVYYSGVRALSSTAYQTQYVIEYILGASDIYTRVNDAQVGTSSGSFPTNTTWTGITSSAFQQVGADIGTLLISDGAVASGDSTIIVNYLKTKYGI